MLVRLAAVPVGVGLLVMPAFSADEKKQAKPPSPKVVAPKPAPVPRNAGKAAAPQPNPVREQRIERLLGMSPEDRERALQGLPEQQRKNIERGLREYGKIPVPERGIARTRAEMLQALPQQRRGQVRRSVAQFEALPEERKQQVAQELRRMSSLPDEERRAYMNTEEFRNRYSPTEQQMMSNISEITPDAPPPHD